MKNRSREKKEDTAVQRLADPRTDFDADAEAQHLDMIESDDSRKPRGDADLFDAPDDLGEPDSQGDELPLAVDHMIHNFHFDMAEDRREGDDMSGDEHSSGLQGGDVEPVRRHGHNKISTGIPGDATDEVPLEVRKPEKKKAG